MKTNETQKAVQVVGGKYHGCILTFVRHSALGPVVIIDRSEKTLEATTKVVEFN